MFGYTPYAIKAARYQYSSPAAQQMLMGGTNFRAPQFSDFPQKLARVAITSGAMEGDLQIPSVYKSQLVADYRYSFVKGTLGSWSVYGKWISQDRAGNYYDNVPGSFLYQFDTAFDNIAKSEGTFTVYNSYQRNNQISFIPTESALAMKVSALATGVKSDFKFFSPFDKFIAADSTSVCGQGSDTYSDNRYRSRNIPHDNFDSAQLRQLRCAIDEYQVPTYKVPDRSFKIPY